MLQNVKNEYRPKTILATHELGIQTETKLETVKIPQRDFRGVQGAHMVEGYKVRIWFIC